MSSYDKHGRRIKGDGPAWDTRAPDDPEARRDYGFHPAVQLLVIIAAIALLVALTRAFG